MTPRGSTESSAVTLLCTAGVAPETIRMTPATNVVTLRIWGSQCRHPASHYSACESRHFRYAIALTLHLKGDEEREVAITSGSR